MTGQRHHTTTDYNFAAIPEELLHDPKISPLAVRVYGILHRHGQQPDSCYPSYRRIAELAGCSQRSIPATVKALEESGWIDVVARWDERGDRTSNGYHVRSQRTPRVLERTPPAFQDVDPPARESAHKESNSEREPVNEEQPPNPPDGETPPDINADVLAVFDAWREALGHPDTKLGDRHLRPILRAFETHPLADAIDAVRGIRHSLWHMGLNEHHRRIDSIATALKTPGEIDRFKNLEREHQTGSAFTHSKLKDRDGFALGASLRFAGAPESELEDCLDGMDIDYQQAAREAFHRKDVA